MKSVTHETPIDLLDPNRPIPRDKLDVHYVERATRTRARIRELLHGERAKVFLSGQSGIGKSTELIKLWDDLDGDFLPMWVAVGVIYDLATVSEAEIQIAAVHQVVQQAKNLKWKPTDAATKRMDEI